MIDEEIYITNKEYDVKLGEFYSKIEQIAEEAEKKSKIKS